LTNIDRDSWLHPQEAACQWFITNGYNNRRESKFTNYAKGTKLSAEDYCSLVIPKARGVRRTVRQKSPNSERECEGVIAFAFQFGDLMLFAL
jgi:hypothetical protein